MPRRAFFLSAADGVCTILHMDKKDGRGGVHPPECRAMLSRGMKSARGDKAAMSELMRGYQACRIRTGAVKPKRGAR